jgi:DNA-binding beta-propeller fold protein YncE
MVVHAAVLAAILTGCRAPDLASVPSISPSSTSLPTATNESLAARLVEPGWQAVEVVGLRCPTGLAVDAQGTLIVVDAGHDRVVQLPALRRGTEHGSRVDTLPGDFLFSRQPDPDHGVECLSGGGVAVDASRSIFILDSTRVRRFDSTGQVATWATVGPDGSHLAQPDGIAIDVRNGHIYVIDGGSARIHTLDREGRWLRSWGGRGWGLGTFASPAAVAVDGQGRVYVADRGEHRIQTFDSDGHFLTEWGGLGTGMGEFIAPRGVAVDRNGRVYVVDAHRVQVFSDAGLLLMGWPVDGGSMAVLGGIAVDHEGTVYVTDTGRGLVLRYRPRGPWVAAAGTPTPRPVRPTATPGPTATPTPPASMTPTDR